MLPNIPYIKDEKLPSLDSVIDGFKKLEYLNEGDYKYETIKEEYFKHIKLFPNFIAPNGKWGSPLYRTSVINDPNIDITDIQSFSFPIPIYCTKKGRCNLIEHPVFYASIDVDTALRERRKDDDTPLQKGDEVYISHWKIKEKVDFRYAQFIFNDDVKLGKLIKKLNLSNKTKLVNLSTSYSRNKQQSFEYLNNKLSEFFLLKNYNFSSFVAHNTLYENSKNLPFKADAILYPSLQASYESLNFAIHPDFVLNNLELVKVDKIKFIEFINDGVSVELQEIGIPNKLNKIDWHCLTFSLNKENIIDIGLMFDNEPIEHIFNDNDEFLFNEKIELMPNIVWKLIELNQKNIFSCLEELNEVFVEDKVYSKTFCFKLKDGEVILNKNSIAYKIITIKTTINYKVSLQPA